MPAEHFAALIQRWKPNQSVRSIAHESGLAEHKIAHYLKPGTKSGRLPPVATMKDIAHALGAPVPEVAKAFAADLGLDLEADQFTPEEREIVMLWRSLSKRDQRAWLAVGRSLADS